ncbi:hypothetical protein [Streptomyces sp. NPDC058304]|uniref:hypothetical protein n=1 Tax=Streptomyces sp. NPDC058304 TaxID=3346437 RepID=UPI0036E2B62D
MTPRGRSGIPQARGRKPERAARSHRPSPIAAQPLPSSPGRWFRTGFPDLVVAGQLPDGLVLDGDCWSGTQRLAGFV